MEQAAILLTPVIAEAPASPGIWTPYFWLRAICELFLYHWCVPWANKIRKLHTIHCTIVQHSKPLILHGYSRETDYAKWQQKLKIIVVACCLHLSLIGWQQIGSRVSSPLSTSISCTKRYSHIDTTSASLARCRVLWDFQITITVSSVHSVCALVWWL